MTTQLAQGERHNKLYLWCVEDSVQVNLCLHWGIWNKTVHRRSSPFRHPMRRWVEKSYTFRHCSKVGGNGCKKRRKTSTLEFRNGFAINGV